MTKIYDCIIVWCSKKNFSKKSRPCFNVITSNDKHQNFLESFWTLENSKRIITYC